MQQKKKIYFFFLKGGGQSAGGFRVPPPVAAEPRGDAGSTWPRPPPFAPLPRGVTPLVPSPVPPLLLPDRYGAELGPAALPRRRPGPPGARLGCAGVPTARHPCGGAKGDGGKGGQGPAVVGLNMAFPYGTGRFYGWVWDGGARCHPQALTGSPLGCWQGWHGATMAADGLSSKALKVSGEGGRLGRGFRGGCATGVGV